MRETCWKNSGFSDGAGAAEGAAAAAAAAAAGPFYFLGLAACRTIRWCKDGRARSPGMFYEIGADFLAAAKAGAWLIILLGLATCRTQG